MIHDKYPESVNDGQKVLELEDIMSQQSATSQRM